MSQDRAICHTRSVGKVIAKNQTLFEDVNFSLEPGQIAVLFGPNGVGKTTLIRILSGAILPSSGQVFIQGIDTKHSAQLKKLNVGLAPGVENSFFSRLNGIENLRFFSRLQNVSIDVLNKEVDEWRQLPSFHKALGTPYVLCSSGMKQILSLFRALLGEPMWVLLDEPMQSLDEVARKFILEQMQKVRARKGALLFSTHLPELTGDLCDHRFKMEGQNLCSL